MRLKLREQGLILAAVPLLLELVLLGGLWALLNESETQAKRQEETRHVREMYLELVKQFDLGINHIGGYLATDNEIHGEPARQAMGKIPELLRNLELLQNQRQRAADTPEKRRLFQEMAQNSNRALDELSEARRLMSLDKPEVMHGPINHALVSLRNLKILIERDIDELVKAERAIENESGQRSERAGKRLKALIGFGIVLNVAFPIALAVFFFRWITGRLAIMSDNSVRLASGVSLHPTVKGNDEIAELDRSFHSMARQIAEAAKKERAMIENAVDVICSISADGQFIEVSPASFVVWGYEPAELIGQRYVSIVADEDKEATLAEINGAAQSKTAFTYENRLKRKNGSTVDLLWSGCWSDEGKALFCVAHDVSERKRIEQLKRDFVAMISHDLRTPLTSVQVYLEMVAEGFFEDKGDQLRKKASLSEADVSRLINLINNLLDIEKMESGKMEVVTQLTPVPRIIERSVSSVAALADKKRIEIEASACDDTIYADEDQLVQVLVNLLSNALKFSPDESPVHVRAFEKDGGIRFEVEDRGRGISAEFKDRVFDRFQQVELEDSRVKGGSGLGLAICKAIVEAHRGQIGVNSVEGEGATFWFDIPSK